MSKLPRVVEVEHLGKLCLRLTFSDGLVRELDFDAALHGCVLEPIRDPGTFGQVKIDDLAGTIGWPNGVDLDPDVLHGDHEPASGRAPVVLKEYRLRPTA
ncbi:MAG: DUF2442 domain-containing protein [Acidimicrobiales bacterium]